MLYLMMIWFIYSIKNNKLIYFLKSLSVIFDSSFISDLCSHLIILFVLKLYADIITCLISYKLVRSLIYILFFNSSSHISLLNTSCQIIMFFHRNFAIAVNIVCVRNLVLIQSDKFFWVTIIYFLSQHLDILITFTETFLNRILV